MDQRRNRIMVDRSAFKALAAALVLVAAPLATGARGSDQGPAARPRPFRIHVVEAGTGRGVPLVELKTVNQVRYYTDSNGIVAFDEPGLFNQKVYFSIRSHGYEAEKDGLGYRGASFVITEGGTAQVVIRRLNIARRLYRVTGEGIYRDSVLTGDKVPIGEPLLNGQVFGQDSVINAVFQGKIHWFWGDTNRPDYPLGNFHVPGATSELPGRGGLEPEDGVNLTYFVDDKGFARPTAPMPGEGPTWISGLTVLTDDQGRERMFAFYAKIRKMLEVYERGLVEFNPGAKRFEKVTQFPEASEYSGEHPDGHPFLHQAYGINYIYYANPYPLLRVRADPDLLKEPAACEAYTCLVPGTRVGQQQLDRGPDGRLHYAWKIKTQLLRHDQQAKLIAARQITVEESLLNLRDIDSGKTVVAHGGSVYWNSYRNRWVMITVESYGSPSLLGEIWYAEADSPLGPWVYARKVVTHDRYSFYNPKQHPMFDKDGGRIIFFEGTYTTTFSGNQDPTPRYDYNQVMYQLDLSDPRLALPVAVYLSPASSGAAARLVMGAAAKDGGPSGGRRVAFFAPDRAGIATLPVYEDFDARTGQTLRVASGGQPGGPQPLFFLLPADLKDYTAATAPLHEWRAEGNAARVYSTDARSPQGGARWTSKVLGRVWKNPSSLVIW
jgi:hypothetical protein